VPYDRRFFPQLAFLDGGEDMKVMVVGGGGREHAIIKKLKENKKITELYALPGNGGIAADATCVSIGAKDLDGIRDFAVSKGIDFAVVAPDDPLVLGAVDELKKVGVKCFGPDKKAAIIEGSKVFSKDLMKKYGIPTAEYRVFTNMNEALEYIDTAPVPTVVKADGLALGKGVIIAQTRQEAKDAVRSMMEEGVFGDSGKQVVIEEFLTGPEVSVLAFTDGKAMVPMVSSMDHKRAGDGDTGLNTGGMGTVAPNPYYTEKAASECMEKIFIPTMNAMNSEGRTFKGCLYFGLMLTPKGPKVIEYNCRFGDPETQVVLPLLETDLLSIMEAVAEERLSNIEVKFKDGYACCVVMASEGYPKSYETGFEITADSDMDAEVYIAGAKKDGARLLTGGGRVLGVTATAESLEKAVEKAYLNVKKVHFKNAYYRNDIGKRALEAEVKG
jgi:phosphoribosylamine--glycine ligase